MLESIDDPVFGRLEWDHQLDWWVGTVEFAPGHRIDVFVDHAVGTSSPAEEIASAKRKWEQIRLREPTYRRWSAERLHQTRWNADEPMTVDDITQLFRLATVEFSSDGSVLLFWDDQDVLFGGHNVVTELNSSCECVAAGMQ